MVQELRCGVIQPTAAWLCELGKIFFFISSALDDDEQNSLSICLSVFFL